MNNQLIELYRTRDMGQVLSVSIKLFKQHFKSLFKLILLTALPPYILGQTLVTLVGKGVTGMDIFDSLDGLAITQLSFGYFCSMVGSFLVYWTAIYYVQNYQESQGQMLSTNQLFNKIKSHGWQMIPAAILIGLLFLVLFVPVLFVLKSNPAIGALLVFALLIVMFLLIIPLVLYFPIFLIEKSSFIETFSRSFYLLKRHWLQTIGMLIVIFIILMVIVGIPSSIVGILIGLGSAGLMEPDTFNTSNIALLLISQNIIAFLSLYISLWTMIAFTVHYYSLVETKDQVSLSKAIDSMDDGGSSFSSDIKE